MDWDIRFIVESALTITRTKLQDWQLVKKYNAIVIDGFNEIRKSPADRYLAFETTNFGFILSPKDKDGFRRIVEKE